VNENGAYAVLLEYENMEGYLLSTEVTKKRVKLVNKYMKVGKQEPMMVIRVDRDKRYIDLSKKKVLAADGASTEITFKKAKMVHNILKQMAVKIGPECTLRYLYEKFGWDLYDKYGHAFDAFRLISSDPEAVFKEISISEEEKKVLIESIARKMAPTPLKLRADFELTCFSYEGIDALKAALLGAKAKVNAVDPAIQISFKMIAPPHYRIETVTLKKNEGLALLDQALREVEAGIKERNGTFKLVNKPQIIGDSAKDKDLEEIMKMPGEYESGEGGSSAEEDNEEGMGDVDLEDEFGDPTADIDQEEDGEERKTSKVKESKKKRKASSDEDDQ
jgi:translation initiation factor 2 subunit 1